MYNWILTSICFSTFLIDIGLCFRFDPDTDKSLCLTQCAALKVDDQYAYDITCNNNTSSRRFWMTNCDELFSDCIGTCQIKAAKSRRISNIFLSDYIYDDSTRYPARPTLHIHGLKHNSILLSWDQSNDANKVFYTIQMKEQGDDVWRLYMDRVEGNSLNITTPDICLYQFRIIAINQFGSNGFSAPISVNSVPLIPINNLTLVGGVYYHEPTAEFMSVIKWDDISALDDQVVSNYSWNDISYVKCPRISQNMQPTFLRFSPKHGRKFILMRVSRDAYGCTFTTQIHATSVCGEVGGWTNFTVDLTDCHEIHNFPCSLVDPDFSPPGIVENATIKIDDGQNPPLIRLTWEPPTDLGSEGTLDHYDIRWGKVEPPNPKQDDMLQFNLDQPDFLSTPQLSKVAADVHIFTVQVTVDDLVSSKYGFQIVPIAPGQKMTQNEYDIFPKIYIQSSRHGSNHSIHGIVLMDGDVRIVQVPPDSPDIEVAWHLQDLSKHSTIDSHNSSFNDNYAVKFGKADSRPFSGNVSVTLVDGSESHLKITLTEPGDYCIQIIGLEDDTLPDESDWKDTKIYNFTVNSIGEIELVDKDKDGFSVAVIVILPILIIVTIPTTLIIIKWLCTIHKLKKKFELEGRLGDLTTDFTNDYTNFDRHPLTAHYHSRNPEIPRLPPTVVPDNWEVPHTCLKVGRVLGSGAFGQVLKGRVSTSVILNRKMTIPRDTRVDRTYMSVAVKMLRENADDSHRQEFMREISLMKMIGSHINIVSMLGCCTLQDPICLIVEHLTHGDLRTYLNKIREAIQMREENESDYINRDIDILSPVDLLSFARQIAVGMEFLSSKCFVHRDLAARNVLVGEGKIVKIGDFGLTRFIYNDQIYVNRKGGKFPLKWMSIEAIQELKFSSASDVWSFGVVLFEIVTLGGTPYPTVDPRDLLEYLKTGSRMERPDNCSDELYKIMTSCWERCPQDRPSFTTLKECLESMLLDTCGLEYFNFLIDKTKYYYNIIASDEATVAITGNLNEDENERGDVSLSSSNDTVSSGHVSLDINVEHDHDNIEHGDTIMSDIDSTSVTKDHEQTECKSHFESLDNCSIPESNIQTEFTLDVVGGNVLQNNKLVTQMGTKYSNSADVAISETNSADDRNAIDTSAPENVIPSCSLCTYVSKAKHSTQTALDKIHINESNTVEHPTKVNLDVVNSLNGTYKDTESTKCDFICIDDEKEIENGHFSPNQTNKKSIQFDLERTLLFDAEEDEYEADDSSLSESSPSSCSQRYSLSSSNDDDDVFRFPNQMFGKRYPQEKHPRFRNRLRKNPFLLARRELSNLTDSGISTTSYSESPV